MLRFKEGTKSGAGTTRRGEPRPAALESRKGSTPATSALPELARLSTFDPSITPVSSNKIDSTDREVRALRGLDALKDLRADWEAIQTPSTSPMQSYDWVRAWAEVYGIDRDLELFVAGRGGVTAIAPLVRTFR